MEFKENNPDCDCCEPDTTGPCEIFADDFNRTDSSTVGNGWTGTASIKNQRLEIMGANNVMAPADGGPGTLIQATVRFSGPNQELRIYWAGTGNYVGFRPTNYDSSTKRNVYIFANGAVQSSVVFSNGTLNMNTPYTIAVCVDSGTVEANGATYNAASIPTGQAGLGAVGSFSNGPVIVDDFAIRIVGEACHSCGLPFVNCELDCSGEFSWMVDLSGFTGMVKNARPDASVDCDCPNLGTYLLEPSGFCSWSYRETYCPYYNIGCDVELLIELRIIGNNCRGELTIGISNIPCFSFIVAQDALYASDDHALDTYGTGVVTLRSETPNQKFGRPAWNDAGVAPGEFDTPVCVAEFIQDPSGVDRYTSITVPPTVTITRVG